MASAAIFFLLIIAAAAWTSSTDAAPSPSPSSSFVPPPPCAPPQPAVAFLRARCATTLYGVACYESLLPYACIFDTSHVKLARAAADVNVARLRSISKRVKELVARGAGGGTGGAESAALRDCASTVSSAAGLAKQSAAELAKLDAAAGAAGNVSWTISNAQTWLSASMTNEATCEDGLAVTGAAASPLVARDVVILVVRAKELTSIALALVRGIPVPP